MSENNEDTAGEAAAAGESGEGAKPEPNAGAAAETPVKPEGLADDFFDAETGVKWGDLTERLKAGDEAIAREEAAKEGVPETADAYDWSLPEDLKGPDDKPVKLDMENPMIKLVSGVAHKHGLPNAFVQDLAKDYVEGELERGKQVEETRAAEIAKLGEKAEDRIKAASQFLQETFGAEGDDDLGAAMTELMISAKNIERVEAVMKKLGAPGTVASSGDAEKDTLASLYPTMVKN